MSSLRIINLALIFTIGLFFIMPYLSSSSSFSVSHISTKLEPRFHNQILSLKADDDADIWEYLYENYEHVESFVVRKEGEKIRADIVIKKSFTIL